MTIPLVIIIFIVGYLLIALEHKIHVNKAATALFIGVVLWVILALNVESSTVFSDLAHHFEQIAEILFFLLGAMTIVELIDVHHGFEIVQNFIRTKSRIYLLWILAFVTFFLSAVLDNMTTTIVMVALLKKLFSKTDDRWFFAGFVIIAANAGGAWSPIGDVTTIMLWNANYVSSFEILKTVFLPSLASLLLPLIFTGFSGSKVFHGTLEADNRQINSINSKDGKFILILGVLLLLFVPVFKSYTHLPPFMGMLFALSILWLVTEVLHRKKDKETQRQYSVAETLRRIDTPSVLFFLGILLAVSSLESLGVLESFGKSMEQNFGNFYVSNAFLGLLSAVIDNVPLVAGAMGMYSFDVYPPDHAFWTFLAYCAGTGGSTLIIGSAAGVAAMGLLNIDFLWYVKRFSLLALMGYVAGILVYLIQ
ncbi:MULTISPECIES: sodium:proton antiporter NhaD [Maribacter]|uniref:Sodium:proton antiporter NhaD n=1 Tax=Maribacter flavus TaxID=1658664 RepID=A0ABU7IJK2_9FLAO|nr:MULTISPECIES: sodium:proton antiporter NhaD [Maribacter]MDC6405730.1 sodium:proton antiporter NhaD [Maribacter sp. PR66]MEE1973018.1 sodium:proton antiporter NhaD [Maribacter flavus]